MRFRKLQIAWSVACGIVVVLVVALWVRSYFTSDNFIWTGSQAAISCISSRGQLGTLWDPTGGGGPVEMQGVTFYNWPIKGTNRVEYNDGTGHPLPSFLGFKSSWISDAIRSRYSLWVIPHWFPAFMCGIAAVLPWWRARLGVPASALC
jgi:hypothetical protein